MFLTPLSQDQRILDVACIARRTLPGRLTTSEGNHRGPLLEGSWDLVSKVISRL